jgi:hypothetical protein
MRWPIMSPRSLTAYSSGAPQALSVNGGAKAGQWRGHFSVGNGVFGQGSRISPVSRSTVLLAWFRSAP